MKTKKIKRNLSPDEIDEIVVTQADDDSAWERPVRVQRKKTASVSIPSELAARAKFLARLHRQANAERWLAQIIQERIELEEAAFVGAKRELTKEAR